MTWNELTYDICIAQDHQGIMQRSMPLACGSAQLRGCLRCQARKCCFPKHCLMQKRSFFERTVSTVSLPAPAGLEGEDVLGGAKGQRSALLIRPEWCEQIFKGLKRWEIRSQPTTKRERICIAPCGAGTLMGEVNLVDCLQVGIKNAKGEWEPWGSSKNFLWNEENLKKHGILDPKVMDKHRKLYAWVFDDVQLYETPVVYKHLPGCRSWMTLVMEEDTWPSYADLTLFSATGTFAPEEGVVTLAGHGGGAQWLETWDGARCISANTLGDGACGLHAVFGQTDGCQLKWLKPNGRQRVAEALRTVIEAQSGEQARAVQVALWDELAVPAACGNGGPESRLFWQHLLAVSPALCKAVEARVQKADAASRQSAGNHLQLTAVCREFFLSGPKEGVAQPICHAIGFIQEEGSELCYEEWQNGQRVKGAQAERPQSVNRPETKWEAVCDQDPVYDALRKAVFLNRSDKTAVLKVLEEAEDEVCHRVAETLQACWHEEQSAPEPPREFTAQALPAYMAAVQDAGYFFSADELVAVAQLWGNSLVVVQANGLGQFVPCAATTGLDVAGVVVLVKGGRDGGALRSHYERLARTEDIAKQRAGAPTTSTEAGPAGTESAAGTEGPEAAEGEPQQPAAIQESNVTAPPFASHEDGTVEFENAVSEVLLAFEKGEDVNHILWQLPAYSADTAAASYEQLTEQLFPLVAAYESDALTAQEAVRLQYQLWKSTFFPLAVLVEAWSRTTGMPAVFYLDSITAVCMGLLHKEIAVDVAGWECRSRYWAVGTAQPGSGKSPAVDAIVKCLAGVLSKHHDFAPGHKWDKFHLLEAMTHCAALDKLKVTGGYGTIVAGEGAPLLCPSWPASSTWNQTTHMNLARFLDSANGGSVPWETFVDRKGKKEAAEEELNPDCRSPLERTNVTLVLLQQYSVYLQWWVASEQKNRMCLAQRCLFSFGAAREPGPPSLQLFEQKVVMPVLERIFTAILKTLGPKAPLTPGGPGAIWRVDATEREAFYRYRLACLDVTKRSRFGESFASGLNKAPYMVSTVALFGTLMQSLWPCACAQCLGCNVAVIWVSARHRNGKEREIRRHMLHLSPRCLGKDRCLSELGWAACSRFVEDGFVRFPATVLIWLGCLGC